MKYYTITVNGNTYHVSVEEGVAAPAPVSAAAPTVSAPAPAPVASSAPAPAAQAAPEKPAATVTGSEGSLKVSSPMPGKILAVKASVGQAIKKGDVILILEAMKMENEIVAPQDGTIVSINVTTGQAVEAGTLLATMN